MYLSQGSKTNVAARLYLVFLFTALVLTGCYPEPAKDEVTEASMPKSRASRINAPRHSNELFGVVPNRTPILPAKEEIAQSLDNTSLKFEPNVGQFDPKVKFASRAHGYDFFMTGTETVMVVKKSVRTRSTSEREQFITEQSALRMRFEDANRDSRIAGVDELAGKSNYFLGKDPRKSRTNVSQYRKVIQEGIYPGVDVTYYGNESRLEYDLTIGPGIDPSSIKLSFEGSRKTYIDKGGNLILTTQLGEITQSKPFAYQTIGDSKKTVECRYVLSGKGRIAFELGPYDKNAELTIDPTVEYSTYIGATAVDLIKDVAVDSSGNVYVTGYTTSTNFPTTTGAFRTTVIGNNDAFILKLNPSGSGLVYSTYLGGSGQDWARSITVDAAGNAIITGQTSSTNFPLSNARQSTYGGGGADAFVTKLNAAGNGLLFSTYHGGNGDDFGYGIAIDSSGNSYLTGMTISTNFPTLNAYQSTIGGYIGCPSCSSSISYDAFVSKLSSTGSLVYSTYLGASTGQYSQFYGTITNEESGNGIAVDSQGNAYITGRTNSFYFPTVNPIQSGKGADRNFDAFVTKLNAAGNGIVYSTYLGGYYQWWWTGGDNPQTNDEGIDITVDSAGSAYVVGNAQSSNFPVVNAYQPTNHASDWVVEGYDNPTSNLFITKFNPSGSTLAFSTFFGGSGTYNSQFRWEGAENASAIAVDSTGAIFVTGNTCSRDLPLINPFLQPHKSFFENNLWDAFVAKFTPSGTAIDFTSYYGGRNYDLATGIAVDSAGSAYVVGYSTSTELAYSASAYQQTNLGGYDGFVIKLAAPDGVNIRGRVARPNGDAGGGGITVRLTGAINAETISDYYGYFAFLNLPPNQTYTVAPAPGYFTFLPPSRTFTNLSGDATADFTIEVSTIGGRVTDTNGAAVAGVTLTLSGSASQTQQTDVDGNYLFTDLVPGNYTITPSKVGDPLTYVFTPSSQTFNDLRDDQIANFSATRIVSSALLPIADSYVNDGTAANLNHGSINLLKVETDSKTNNNRNFDSYLKFDLSTITRNVQSAKLRINASSTSGSITMATYPVVDVGWIETGSGSITWNNKPARGANAIASTVIAGTAYIDYDIDLTSYIKSEKAAGRSIISIALHNTTVTSASTFVLANSREAASNQPRLLITESGEDNRPPSVAMTSPANGTVFTSPAAVTVSASATDPDGSITRVDFYNGTSPIGTSTSPVSGSTYSISWNSVPTGSYVLSAIAYDDRGAPATAAPVNVTVNAPNTLPLVSIVSPSTSAVFPAGSNVSLRATASDADGSIDRVEFYAGTSLVATATTPDSTGSYSATWTNVQTGSYSLTAKAFDNTAGSTTSAAVTVTVVGQVAVSPTADAYVQDGSSAATNFGTATDLRAQSSATAGSNRETYLKFDITGATGITKATLRLYGNLNDASGTNVPVRAYGVATTTWTESGSGSITWNNKPASGATILATTTVVNNVAAWYDLDLTSYIQTEKAAGRNTISLALKSGANSSPYVTFASREATTNQPRLVMLTTQPRDVLFVVGSSTLNAAENALKTRVQNLGFTVTAKVAGSNANSSIKATDADGKALVFVSSTVTAANVGTKLRNIPVALINWEADLADDFGMTNTVSGTDFGTAASQDRISIVAPLHPMSDGLSGTVIVLTTPSIVSWGKPNANADKIAALNSDATKFVTYGYDAGKAMYGLESPARRVGIFLPDTTSATLTASGASLFDAAVKWAAQLSLSPAITGLSPSSGNIGTPVTISGSGFGSTQGSSTVTFNGIASTPTTWGNSSIATVVPIGAMTGPVVVTVNGLASNSITFTVNTPTSDSDGDGLPDWWEMQYFGNLGYGANDDPDGDGITNLQEYLQGRNPTRGNIFDPSVVNLQVYTQLNP